LTSSGVFICFGLLFLKIPTRAHDIAIQREPLVDGPMGATPEAMQQAGWEITVELVIGVKQDRFYLRLARFSDALPFEQAFRCQFRMFADGLLFGGREFIDALVISESARDAARPFDFLNEFHDQLS
jgi:hypothetical protein